jgi:hypothetical protein
MFKGINLTLMIGPAAPIPVSKEVLEALTSVQVTTSSDGPSVFQLSFTLSMRSPLHTIFMLAGGATPPMMRVMILVTIGGNTEVLMDGVMTNHEVQPGSDSGKTTLTVTGEDLSRVMDYIDFSGIPYPAMPPSARVALIIAKYAVLGIVPMVIPSIMLDVPIPTQRIPRQQGKDLAYVKRLAAQAGYVFYVEPGPTPGMSTAYWGPEIKVGAPQPALNGDMDAHKNIDSVSFTFNSEARSIPIIFILNEVTKAPIPIPVPDVSPLNPPLGAVSPIPKQFPLLTGTAHMNPLQAAYTGMVEAAKSSEAVRATGTLDVLRYGRLLKARKLVGLRGVGTAFNGLYYVKSVVSNLKRGEFKQNFTLTRNGLISTFSQVPA